MSKTRTMKTVDSVTIHYDLFDLPTTQHKAGLAGLILQIRHMEHPERGFAPEQIPVIEEFTPTTATIRFTPKSVQALFDDVYDASIERVRVKSKWQGVEPLEIVEDQETDTQTGKVTKVKKYVYEVVQPRARFLRQHLPDKMDRSKDWHKLWRDMLWSIPRGVPTTRIPFQQRAADKACGEGASAWKDLLAVEKARQQNGFYTTEVAGALWLGAQAQNAESIPFRGRAEQTLLLHFWPLTVLIFVPQRINNDGESEFVGYTLAIPEVGHLEYFCEDYLQLLHNLGDDVRGFRPAEAIIDLPAQAALEFLAQLSAHVVGKKSIHDDVSSVEYLHLVKIGNNVKSMAAGRIAPKPDLIKNYLMIAGAPGKPPPYHNPLFRAGLLLALVRDFQWYECMPTILAARPWPFFVRSEGTPRHVPSFASDTTAKFQSEWERHQKDLEVFNVTAKQDPAAAGEVPMPELPLLIHRLVGKYVNFKAKAKCNIPKEKKLQELSEEQRQAVYKEKKKYAADAFLAIRSRRDQDFVDYFTASICSVGQYFKNTAEFQRVAEALLDSEERDNVKTLTLLALSANS
jgi:CRISPR-associated protein Cmx8